MKEWSNIPAELRHRAQWCFADESKIPMSLNAQGGTYTASVSQPDQWMDFQTCAKYAEANGLNVGYVLCASDPYTCIDLDVKDAENCPDKPELWTTTETFERFYKIIQYLDSYTERSKSNKGFHIWVKADLGKGVRAQGVEAYSQDRFMICTGYTINPKNIEERQDILNKMIVRKDESADHKLEEIPPEEDDWYVIQKANAAHNGDKFRELWAGHWKELGFPSQSEADLAFMSIIAFYTKSNSQCRSIFRQSALGQREKAQKNDVYLNRTLQLIRSRMAREESINTSMIQQAAELALQRIQGRSTGVLTALHANVQKSDDQPVYSPPVPAGAAISAPIATGIVSETRGIPWPPGLAGKIAHFIYQSAPRPVKEVAIVAAIGLLAGICGKAWHIPQSGLNAYVILVARSGIGKEALHSGIGMLMAACSKEFPGFNNFVDFSEYVSGPALKKVFAERNSFVNICGEWGRKLRRLSSEERDGGPLSTLRTQMTNLYQKSGPQSIAGGLVYSNKEDNVQYNGPVAYSMIGETTPETFYDSLTESMMEDGFMSRFTIIEYTGERPPLNENQTTVPDIALRDSLVQIARQAYDNNLIENSVPVRTIEEVRPYIKAFELECDGQINGTNDEGRRQMWNRAALKALRISALLAVADNWVCPIIHTHHFAWALQVIRNDIALMQRRLDAGDVGTGDDVREKKIFAIIGEYFSSVPNPSYRIPAGFREQGLIPRSYLQIRTARVASFYKHRLGGISALDATLASMVQSGYIAEAKSEDLGRYHGKVYRVIRMLS